MCPACPFPRADLSVQIFVEREEAEAQKMAGETRAIAEDAQRDLAEALPALDAAVACLNKLKKSDIDEVCSGCNCRFFPPSLWHHCQLVAHVSVCMFAPFLCSFLIPSSI